MESKIRFAENCTFTKAMFEQMLEQERISNPIAIESSETGERLGSKYIISGDGGTRLILRIWKGQTVKNWFDCKMYLESKTDAKQYYALRAKLERTEQVRMDFCLDEAEPAPAPRRRSSRRNNG